MKRNVNFASKQLHSYVIKWTKTAYVHQKAKIDALQSFKQLRDKKELARYIGMFAFYLCWFIKPLRKIQGSQSYVWKENHTQALESLNKSLFNAAWQVFPNHRRHMKITADAFNIGIGACLKQIYNGECRPWGFFSWKLSEAERRMNTFEKELLAIVASVNGGAICLI